MRTKINRYLDTGQKSAVALAVTFAGAIGAALADGNLTGAESLIALGTALVAAAAVWQVRNGGVAD